MSIEENTRWYEYNAGSYCGVFMPEHVMKKIVKLNAKYSEEVRKVLQENKEHLVRAAWTCSSHYEGEKIAKQVTVKYSVRGEDVQSRIDLFHVAKPEYVPKVHFVGVYTEAYEICDKILAEELEGDNE